MREGQEGTGGCRKLQNDEVPGRCSVPIFVVTKSTTVILVGRSAGMKTMTVKYLRQKTSKYKGHMGEIRP